MTLWQCTHADLVVDLATEVLQDVSGTNGVTFYGGDSTALKPAPLCVADQLNAPDVLDQFIGRHLSVVDYGTDWMAFRFDGEQGYRCFAIAPFDFTDAISVEFEGQSYDPITRTSFSHDGWWNKWSQPIGKTGTLRKNERIANEGITYLVIGDSLVSPNDAAVFAYWPGFLKKFHAATDQYFATEFFNNFQKGGNADDGVPMAAGDICDKLAYWNYLIPVPANLSFCLLPADYWQGLRWGDQSYDMLFNTMYVNSYIPTPDEWASAAVLPWDDEFHRNPVALVSCERGKGNLYYLYPVEVTLTNGHTQDTVSMAENGILQIGYEKEARIFKLPEGACK